MELEDCTTCWHKLTNESVFWCKQFKKKPKKSCFVHSKYLNLNLIIHLMNEDKFNLKDINDDELYPP